ncbi:unnamed protein product [Heligmosomoides polygyrus]|uniref:PA2c domain-containing protein n=1 Tax=Heligmosomoides polygyrus TaxID=6339 RepID=A0A183G1D0_HELPZ|nr:unnamed protein product [Heligmosomoides polygyrus]
MIDSSDRNFFVALSLALSDILNVLYAQLTQIEDSTAVHSVATVPYLCLLSALPSRSRREDKVERYCAKHLQHYRKFCSDDSAELDRSAMAKLAKFCPAYEKHCSTSKVDDSSDNESYGNLVVPPPLPKGSDFACKCAHTHPKVHAMCNPPSNAQLADTCQKWYAKCPMFQPVQYY